MLAGLAQEIRHPVSSVLLSYGRWLPRCPGRAVAPRADKPTPTAPAVARTAGPTSCSAGRSPSNGAALSTTERIKPVRSTTAAKACHTVTRPARRSRCGTSHAHEQAALHGVAVLRHDRAQSCTWLCVLTIGRVIPSGSGSIIRQPPAQPAPPRTAAWPGGTQRGESCESSTNPSSLTTTAGAPAPLLAAAPNGPSSALRTPPPRAAGVQDPTGLSVTNACRL